MLNRVLSRRFSLGWTTLALFLTAATFFVLGTRSDTLIANLTFSQNKNLPKQLDYSELQRLYTTLRTHYDGNLDARVLLEGAKKGMISATGDPYTTYFTDAEAEQFLSDLDGRFSGIGAEIGKRGENLTIISTIDGSPAQTAGLLAGDIIGRVNDEDVTGWEVERAVAAIRGEKGTTVKLLVARSEKPKEFIITRDAIVDPSVKSELLDGNIGYMRLSRFNDSDTVSLATRAAEEFKSQRVKGIVLDLRGNGGGFVDVAQKVAGLWLESGKTVVEERQGKKVVATLKAQGSAMLKGIPTVVLIDGGSASASEIVAGALHDYNLATLIGEKTFGKGSVQKVNPISGGGQLKVTIAKWYTPKGKNIDKSGIEPDQKVPMSTEDFEAGRDPQKSRAVDFLEGK